MSGDLCNRECIQPKTKNYVEIIGPVQIDFLSSDYTGYWQKTIRTAFNSLALFLLGGTSMSVIYYTLSFSGRDITKSLHVFLSTAGYQILIPVGMLLMNTLFVTAKPKHRNVEHVVVEGIGFVYILLGMFALLVSRSPLYLFSQLVNLTSSADKHATVGFCAVFFGFMTVATGPVKCFASIRIVKILHIVFGTLCFLLSSVSFTLGIQKPVMKFWWVTSGFTKYFLMSFCVIYTMIIAYNSIRAIMDTVSIDEEQENTSTTESQNTQQK